MLHNLFSPDNESPGFQEHEDHVQFKKRIKKTMYQCANNKRPPLPLTELTVDYMKLTAPRQLGKTDMYTASSLVKSTFVPPCTLIVAMMYAQRLRNNSSQQTLDYLEEISSSDLLLVSMLVASKWMIDEGQEESTSREEWMAATNLDSSELGLLEKNFLSTIDWKLSVDKEDYLAFLLNIEKRIAWKQWKWRDSSTYSNLHVLTSHDSPSNKNHSNHPTAINDQLKLTHALIQLISDVFKVTVTCSFAYVILLSGLSITPPLASHIATITIRQPPIRANPHASPKPSPLTIPTKSDVISNDTTINASLHNSSIHPFPVHHSTSHFDIISGRNEHDLFINQAKPSSYVPFNQHQIDIFKFISSFSLY